MKCSLDDGPRLAAAQHRSNSLIPVDVLLAAHIAPFRLCPGLSLGLPAAPVLIVLAGHSGEHVEHHRIDGAEHPPGEAVALLGQHPACREIERDDPDLLRVRFGAELSPFGVSQTGQPIDLLNEEHVARPAIGDEAEKLRAGQLRAALVLEISRGDGEPVLGGERLDAGASAGCVLLIG
jgi:hypothetical protein